MKDQNFLIEKLVKEHSKTQLSPMKSPLFLFFIWFILNVFFSSIVLILTSQSSFHYNQDFFSPKFVLEITIAFLPVLSCGLLSFYLLIPSKISIYKFLLSISPIFIFIVLLFLDLPTQTLYQEEMIKRPHCSLEILFYSLIPIGSFILLGKKGAPLFRKQLAVTLSIASASIFMTFMQLACLHSPIHNLKHHVAPVVVLVVIVLFFNKNILKWDK